MIKLSGSLIICDGELLLLYREDECHWEVPGGKVEEDESPTSAVVREAREEIGVDVELEKPFYTGEFQKDGDLFVWYSYIASTDDTPKIMESRFSDLKWFSSSDLSELDDEELAPTLNMVRHGLSRILRSSE